MLGKKNDEAKHLVLLVEDDIAIGEAIASTLECYEFNVIHVETGRACLDAMIDQTPAIILLDVHLPDQLGYEICKKLREGRHRLVPIIALSGSQDDDDIVKMLDAGADDFVGKKSSVAILIAHMRSALQRIKRQADATESIDSICFGEITIDRNAWKVFISGKEVTLTPTELRLLEAFLLYPGTVFTRDQLISRLHGSGYSVTPRTVDVHINGLRNHLGFFRTYLETVRGIGYRFIDASLSVLTAAERT